MFLPFVGPVHYVIVLSDCQWEGTGKNGVKAQGHVESVLFRPVDELVDDTNTRNTMIEIFQASYCERYEWLVTSRTIHVGGDMIVQCDDGKHVER